MMTPCSTSNIDSISNSSNHNDPSSSWNYLYCSRLWKDTNLRQAYINANHANNKMIKYCYTCKGKIRKYELKSPMNNFQPNNHSTPNGKINNNVRNESTLSNMETGQSGSGMRCVEELSCPGRSEPLQVPSVSHQVDASFRHKYSGYEPRAAAPTSRLRKSFKGIGCVVSLALSDSPLKKRAQFHACSISLMIVAIVVISFVLVNFTSPNFKTKSNSSTIVPTHVSSSNLTSSAIANTSPGIYVADEAMPDRVDITTDVIQEFNVTETADNSNVTKEQLDNISKVRKNIKTYIKDVKKTFGRGGSTESKPKEINNRDLSLKFCSCQTNEVCMLDENSGTAICKAATDVDDPTGCGGLCAMETEACHLVDRARGVRVCRLLALVTCSPREWRCRDGRCVAVAARCDGAAQCYDRSDEMHCECDLTKQFRCGHGISCFPRERLCDGAVDCWDGLDELNCTQECPKEQFTCTSGQCIASGRFCDGLADCGDGSDEPHGCGACAAHERRCRNRRCVAADRLCDGVDHCGDASDEMDCPPS